MASMLWVMYVRSIEDSVGSTRNRCTKAGTTPPASTATSTQRPTAIPGRTQPRRQMLAMNSPVANRAMSMSR